MRMIQRVLCSCVSFALVSSVVLLLSAASAEAGLKNFMAVMNAGQTGLPITSTAIGNAFVTFDSSTGELCWSITYVGLSGNETVSHFHGPASPGVDAPPLVPIPVGNPKQGCAMIDSNTAKALKKGQLYVNVHSDAGPDEMTGEIRGQLIPVKGK